MLSNYGDTLLHCIPFVGPLYGMYQRHSILKEQDRLIKEANFPEKFFSELTWPTELNPAQKIQFIDYCKRNGSLQNKLFIGAIVNAIISIAIAVLLPKEAFKPAKLILLLQSIFHNLSFLSHRRQGSWSYNSSSGSFSWTIG